MMVLLQKIMSLKVCVTGAAGHIAYSLYNLLGEGCLFGSQTTLQLRLLDLPQKLSYLHAVALQLQDSSHRLIKHILVTADPKEAFFDVEFVIFLGGQARRPGQERSDLLELNKDIFQEQGEVLDRVANPNCRCLVVANPVNLMCYILAENCKKLPRQNFSCLMRLDYNRTIAQISKKAAVGIEDVKKVIIWGSHSRAIFPDSTFAEINGEPILNRIGKEWLEGELLDIVRGRGGEVLKKKGQTSVTSAAKAIKDHICEWRLGSRGEYSTMGILLEKEVYGVKQGLCFSMPVICEGGYKVRVVQDLQLNEYQLKKLKQAEADLLMEQSLLSK